MPRFVDRLVQRLNWRRRGWSTGGDRAFHDAAFAGQTYDPFSPSYPGYVTIRRFADLAEPHVHAGDHVLDLGCGPGEVTCELARRLPDARFTGIDHSEAAIARAKQLAARLALPNLQFETQDLERFAPAGRARLVMMFDAFHHLLDPAGFIRRLGQHTDRFFLIEPAGNRFGQWQRTLDVDWLAEAIFTIRDRLEYQFNLPAEATGGSAPAPPAGEPTEHRYSLDDFSRWFTGYGLDIRGTLAGLERYGTAPYAASPLRDDIGRNVYSLIAELEATLRRADLDLAAKHWAIYAERGGTFPARAVPSLQKPDVQQPLPGPYDAEYAEFQGPSEARAGTTIDATVRITNRSWRTWASAAAEQPILLSYHWLDANGAAVVDDGLRTPLPRPLAPGESCTASLRVRCPDTPGRYVLAVDLVHEGVSWFSHAGAPTLRVPLRVIRRSQGAAN